MTPRTLVHLPDYELVARVGRGAGAVIYEAHERATRRRVTVKHVVRRSAEDDKFISQAETEYEVAHNLDHQYLRKCYDIIRVRRWLKTHELLLLMEFVDGERLEDRRPDDLEPAAAIFAEIAAGLQAMHRQGYVHADIKPNNILLTRDGGLKIIDFGQSCPMGHRKERIQGTPDYMAPEQVLRQPLDQRTDVFNLGATMYWVVTGKAYATMMSMAPAGTKKVEIEARRGNERPHELNPATPLPLSKLIMDCCATEKGDRPWDMSEVISRLNVVQHLLSKRPDRVSSGTQR
jgi:serine/threonine-protein kinase